MKDITRLLSTGADTHQQPTSPFQALPPDYFILMRRPPGSVPAA